jgi:hypothetical protein
MNNPEALMSANSPLLLSQRKLNRHQGRFPHYGGEKMFLALSEIEIKFLDLPVDTE